MGLCRGQAVTGFFNLITNKQLMGYKSSLLQLVLLVTHSDWSAYPHSINLEINVHRCGQCYHICEAHCNPGGWYVSVCLFYIKECLNMDSFFNTFSLPSILLFCLPLLLPSLILSSAAGVSASFGEMLLLVAMYFHSNQLSAIIELVCSTLGMKVSLSSELVSTSSQ